MLAETKWEVYEAISGIFADCAEAGDEVGVVDCDADTACSG